MHVHVRVHKYVWVFRQHSVCPCHLAEALRVFEAKEFDMKETLTELLYRQGSALDDVTLCLPN